MKWILLHILGGVLVASASVTHQNPYEISPIKTEPTAVFDSTSSIYEYIETAARKEGIDPYIPLYIAEHESHFDPTAVGDGHIICKLPKSPNYGKPTRSRGIFQISDCANYQVSDAEAFSVASSTAWSLAQIKAGNASIWTTWRSKISSESP